MSDAARFLSFERKLYPLSAIVSIEIFDSSGQPVEPNEDFWMPLPPKDSSRKRSETPPGSARVTFIKGEPIHLDQSQLKALRDFLYWDRPEFDYTLLRLDH